MAAEILDKVGWRAGRDLSSARLLEPAAGGGEFVVQAAERLVESFRRRGIEPRAGDLRPRIVAFEIYARASSRARARLVRRLVGIGIHKSTARACSKAWIRTGDFLLSDPALTAYTHVVGNPPYARWNKVPRRLRTMYEERLSPQTARGDLYLPILDRALDELKNGGMCGVVCSDRWQFAAYGRSFRRKWMPRLDVLHDERVHARRAFKRDVSTYANVLVAYKRWQPKVSRNGVRRRGIGEGQTLIERGCVIRVGPALGVTPAFVVEGTSADIEPELLAPWVDSPEVHEGRIEWAGRYVVSLFDEHGLRDVGRYPKLARHLEQYREALEQRYVVGRGAPWYRTIDRLRASDWRRPKLLVPEISKRPRVALDRSGLVPSHGLYAIFPPEDDVELIYEALRDGGLARRLVGIAPTLGDGSVRCYKRFLSPVRV